MKKYGKKMTLSAEEKNAIFLGKVEPTQTATYKRALSAYNAECEMLARSGYILQKSTRLWYDSCESCFKMLFVTDAEEQRKTFNIKDIFKDLDFDNIFGKVKSVFQ